MSRGGQALMAGQGESMTSAKRLAAAHKQRQALELRKAGYGFQFIADQLGYDGPSGAFKAVNAALKKTLQEPADEYRALHHARLEQIWKTIYPQIVAGNLNAIDRGIKVLAELADLFGLNAPIKIDLKLLLQQTADEFGLTPEEVSALQVDVVHYLESSKASTP